MTVQHGIFFDMPEADYFAIPALSASGIKHMRASPLDFWVRSPLNPNLAAVQEEEGPNSEALQIGKAFDVRIISGRAAFDAAYCGEFVGEEGMLRTQDDLKTACRARGLAVGGCKADLIERLTISGGFPPAQIYDLCREAYSVAHVGKTFLSHKWLGKIEIAAAMIEKDPVLSKAFTGGAPQVTIVWHCDKIGVDCKARLDYLKAKAIVDLKTLLNQRGYPVAQAVNREIANRRYHLQAAFYLEAASKVAGFIRKGMSDGKAPEYDMFAKALLADHPKTFLFVFQIKGVAPVAIGRTLPAESTLLQIAQAEIEAAKQTYRQCMDHFGPDIPWITPTAIEPLQDDDIPGYMLT